MKNMFLALMVALNMNVSSPVQDYKPLIVIVNDDIVYFEDVFPQIRDGTTYVPMRNVVDSIGADITWNSKDSSALITKKGKSIQLDVSNSLIYDHNGNIHSCDMYISNNRIMVPLRVIATYLGYKVNYIQSDNIVRAKENKIFEVSDKSLLKKLKEKIEKERIRIIEMLKPKKEKLAYITFDDGPSRYTQSIIDTLNKYSAKGTFFLLGNNIVNYPDEVEKIIESGNNIGLHGVSHDHKKIYKSPNTLADEMNADNEILFNVMGIKSNIIRTPYGSMPYMKKDFRDEYVKYGYRMWDWNIDSKDSLKAYVEPKEIIKNVKLQLRKIENENKTPIILMHETYHSAKALESIVKYLKEKGYDLVPISYKQTPYNYWNDTR